jgi:hypothetical protein
VLGNAAVLAVLLELVKVAIGPAHHDLEHIMKAAEPDRARDPDESQDRREDLLEGDLELVDGRCGWSSFLGWHLHHCRSG